MSLPRPAARVAARLALVLVGSVGLVAVGAGVASAHVTIATPSVEQGGEGDVTFDVPDESDSANTVRVQVQIPDSTPLAQVLVQPVPGWSVTTTTHTLTNPLKTDDGDTVTDVVSVIDWQATAGGIPPGQFQTFTFSGGPFPDKATMTFGAVQTYSDGTVVSWIDPTVAGQPEPQHPAPVLHLTASSDSSTTGTATAASSSSTGGGSSTLAVVALVVAVVGLVAGVTGLLLGLRARRRSVEA